LELARLLAADITEKDVALALGDVDALWAALIPKNQARVLALLIERIDHDGKASYIEITFHPAGVKMLASGIRSREETAA
jgi:hypothetical protein